MEGQKGETRGAALRRLREAKGLGVSELAWKARLPEASVRDWEADRHTPSVSALERLLDALDAGARVRARLLAGTGSREARKRLIHTPWGAPVDLGQVLRAMRARRNGVQAEVARTVGVRQGTLAKWESGDARPSDDALERLLAALDATPEEAAALHATRGEVPSAASDVEGRLVEIAHHRPTPLREVLLLGLEAELWARATREPAADAALARTVATRAQQAIIRGSRGEIGAHARRALRLAEAADEADAAVAAVYAMNWLRQRAPGGATGAARSLGRWASRMRAPLHRDWLASSQALALVRAGETSAGVEILERLWNDAEAETQWWRLVGEDLVEAWLLAGEPDGAARMLEALGASATEIAVAKVAAARGRRPSPDLIARLRADDDRTRRDEAARIAHLAQRVRRGGSPTLL